MYAGLSIIYILYIYMCVFPGRAPLVRDFQRRRRLTGVKTSITVCVAVCVLQCVCSRCLTGVRTSIKCRGGRDKAPRSILNLKFYFMIHTHTHTMSHACNHARACARALSSSHTHISHTCTHTPAHARTHTDACVRVCTCVYIQICTYRAAKTHRIP